MNYLQGFLTHLKALPNKTKISLIFGLSLIILGTSLVSWWVLAPTYAVLFNRLEAQDANQIINQLEQAHISYQLADGGSSILIDKTLIAKTRLNIMGSGLQLAGSVGFELFDKSDFGMTDFSQKINYQRALQGELERTISSFAAVEKARVHLMLPESRLFEKDEEKAKAAVSVHLKKPLTARQVRSIQELLAATVSHLSLSNVVVVDQNGTTLNVTEEDPSISQLTSKKAIETYLNDKVLHMLKPIFKQEQVLVKIDVSLNYDELERELIKPQSNGQITHEKEITNASGNKDEKNKNNQVTTSERSYQLGSEKQVFKRASGTIDRLSISVVIPQTASLHTREQVQRLVENVVGFNKARGDVISVEALMSSVKKSPAPIPLKITSIQEPKTFYEPWLILIILCAFTATSSAVLLKNVRHKKRQQLLLELTHWLTEYE